MSTGDRGVVTPPRYDGPPMRPFIPLATWTDRVRALAVFGGIGGISVFHVFGPLPEGHDMALHGLHSALEGLYYLPLLLAGYWWGGWPAGTCGIAVSGI